MQTFGYTAADVVQDAAGNIVPGVQLQVWTASDGVQITDLYDWNGNPLPGVVTSDAQGRYGFKIAEDTRRYVVIKPPGTIGLPPWGMQSQESIELVGPILDQFPAVVDKANQALAAANQALNQTRGNLVDEIPLPWIAAHRGGANLHPEHSMEAYRAAAADGFLPEIDLRKLADGSFGSCHDSTVTRTMIGITGNVSAATRATWKAAKILPTIPGGDYGTPALWDEILNEFGGRIPLLAEVKVNNEVNLILDTIIRRGLQRSVYLHSFDFNTAKTIAQAGVASGYLIQGVVTQTAAEIRDAGIEWAAVSRSTVQSQIDSYKAVGLKVAIWTGEDELMYAADLAKGADGIISDDPWYSTKRYRKTTADPFRDRTGFPGWQEGYPAIDSPSNIAPLWGFQGAGRGEVAVKRNTVAARTRALTQNWAGILNGTFTIRARLRYGTDITSETRFLGMFIGRGVGGVSSGPDAVFRDESSAIAVGQVGYHAFWRRDGNIVIFKTVDGVATQIAIQSTGIVAMPVGKVGYRDVELRRTPTQITALDLTNGINATVADSSYTGDMFLALTANGMDGNFSGVNIL